MKKVKKNKSMFDELLNAMDMVGFLDEVQATFCKQLASNFCTFLYQIFFLYPMIPSSF